jgi:hypothetical protein
MSTSVLASKSPPPLPSDGALLTLIGAVFFSGFIFQPSILSLQATLPNPSDPESLVGSLIVAAESPILTLKSELNDIYFSRYTSIPLMPLSGEANE